LKVLQTQHIETCPDCGHEQAVGNTAWLYFCLRCKQHVSIISRWYDDRPEHHVYASANTLIKKEEDYLLAWSDLSVADRRRLGLIYGREKCASSRAWTE